MAEDAPRPGPAGRRACGCAAAAGALQVVSVRDRGGLALVRVRHDACGRQWNVVVTAEDET